MIGIIAYHLFQGSCGTMLGLTNENVGCVLNLSNTSMAF